MSKCFEHIERPIVTMLHRKRKTVTLTHNNGQTTVLKNTYSGDKIPDYTIIYEEGVTLSYSKFLYLSEEQIKGICIRKTEDIISIKHPNLGKPTYQWLAKKLENGDQLYTLTHVDDSQTRLIMPAGQEEFVECYLEYAGELFFPVFLLNKPPCVYPSIKFFPR